MCLHLGGYLEFCLSSQRNKSHLFLLSQQSNIYVERNGHEQLNMEDILPITLKNLLIQISQDNVLLNWRIFGGNQTTICIKFESKQVSISQSSAKVDSPMHSQPLAQFRRKSPGSMLRDMNRYTAWQAERDLVESGSMSPGHQYDNNSEHNEVTGNQSVHTNHIDAQTVLRDSGIRNSTPIYNTTNRDNNFMTIRIDSSVQTVPENYSCDYTQADLTKSDLSVQTVPENYYHELTQTDLVNGQDISLQTEKCVAKNQRIQTDRASHKYTQTKHHRVHRCNKAIQLMPVSRNQMSQALTVEFQDASTNIETFNFKQQDTYTETEPPRSRHVQTSSAPTQNVGVTVCEVYSKSTQTERKKSVSKPCTVVNDIPSHTVLKEGATAKPGEDHDMSLEEIGHVLQFIIDKKLMKSDFLPNG